MGNNRNRLKEELMGAVIGITRACENNPKTENTDRIIFEGLIATEQQQITDAELTDLIERMHTEKYTIVPDCKVCKNPCGNTNDYDMNRIWDADESIKNWKLKILHEVNELAEYSLQILKNGESNQEIFGFFYKALAMVSYEFGEEDLKLLSNEAVTMIKKCKIFG